MIFSFLRETLTFLSAPGKRAALASQARQILSNRQPEPELLSSLSISILTSRAEDERERERPIMTVETQGLKKTGSVRSRASPGREIDTGFPEPLSPDRNTTLRHPDADTSANATIEASSFDLTRSHSKRSVFGRHHSHRSTNSGILPPDQLYGHIEPADRSKEKMSQPLIEKAAAIMEPAVPAVPAPSTVEATTVEEAKKDDGQRLSSQSSASSEDDILMEKGLMKKESKRKGVLKKLQLRS